MNAHAGLGATHRSNPKRPETHTQTTLDGQKRRTGEEGERAVVEDNEGFSLFRSRDSSREFSFTFQL